MEAWTQLLDPQQKVLPHAPNEIRGRLICVPKPAKKSLSAVLGLGPWPYRTPAMPLSAVADDNKGVRISSISSVNKDVSGPNN